MPERSVGKVLWCERNFPSESKDFEEITTEDFYYVDKTLFIKELLQNWGEGEPVYPSQAVWQVPQA